MTGGAPREGHEAEGRVRATYDLIAAEYDEHIGAELEAKPLERALLRALADLAGPGILGDVGCGPGHVSRFLAQLRDAVMGVDLSPAMVRTARAHDPAHGYAAGSMLDLPVVDGAWAGAVVPYSIIHLAPDERRRATGELGRAVRSGGWVLVSFHVDCDDTPAGGVRHLTEWFSHPVDVDAYFLDPLVVAGDLEAAGFSVMATLQRRGDPDVEFPSRRCTLLARRA